MLASPDGALSQRRYGQNNMKKTSLVVKYGNASIPCYCDTPESFVTAVVKFSHFNGRHAVFQDCRGTYATSVAEFTGKEELDRLAAE